MEAANNFNAAVGVRRRFGMRGYGIYIRLQELVADAPNRALKYDLDDLEFDIREDREVIKSVVEDFGLFVVEDDKITELGNTKKAREEAERKEEIRRKRSEAGKRSAEKRKQAREQLEKQAAQAQVQQQVQATSTQYVGKAVAKSQEQGVVVSKSANVEQYNRLIAFWNSEAKANSRAEYRYKVVQAEHYRRYAETIDQYSEDEIKKAFVQACLDSFNWTFDSAIKVGNVPRLIAKEAITKENKVPDTIKGENASVLSGRLRKDAERFAKTHERPQPRNYSGEVYV